MKKTVASVAGLAVAVVALSACTSAPPASTGSTPTGGAASSAPAGGGTIAIIAKANSADYWIATRDGAVAAGKELGVAVTFNGPDSESEGDKQLNMLQTAINNKPLGIGFAPQDGAQDAAPTLIQQAKDAGIPVVAFDTPLASSDLPIATVASDNTGMGAQAAEQLIKLTGGKGKIAIIAHGEIGTAALRRDGFKDYVTKNAPGLQIVDIQNGESDPAKSRDKAQGIMQAHPDLVGFYGTDDDSTIAAADEVDARGAKVKVVGIDTSPDVLTLINQGKIDGVIAQNPYDMGYQTVKILVAASKGTQPTEKNIVAKSVWVTKDNQNDPEVKQVLRTA